MNLLYFLDKIHDERILHIRKSGEYAFFTTTALQTLQSRRQHLLVLLDLCFDLCQWMIVFCARKVDDCLTVIRIDMCIGGVERFERKCIFYLSFDHHVAIQCSHIKMCKVVEVLTHGSTLLARLMVSSLEILTIISVSVFQKRVFDRDGDMCLRNWWATIISSQYVLAFERISPKVLVAKLWNSST